MLDRSKRVCDEDKSVYRLAGEGKFGPRSSGRTDQSILRTAGTFRARTFDPSHRAGRRQPGPSRAVARSIPFYFAREAAQIRIGQDTEKLDIFRNLFAARTTLVTDEIPAPVERSTYLLLRRTASRDGALFGLLFELAV